MEVSRCLLEAVSQEGLSVKLTGRLGRPSATQLQGFLQLFRSVWPLSLTKPQVPLTCPHSLTPPHRGHPDACSSQQAVLQLACAVVEALTGDRSRHWEEMASIEKVRSPRERSTVHLTCIPSFSHAHTVANAERE